MLTLRAIDHRYGSIPVLDGISFRLPKGRVFALTGPSGAGKTTLLHIAAGLLAPTSGTVDNRFRCTAYVFQDPRLLPWRTAAENIAFGLKARGVEPTERRYVAEDIAHRLGLGSALEKYPRQLSGGMRQRVAIGRALALDPDLLLLDEPFSALDIGLRRELEDLVLDLLVERGLAALFVTHDLLEAVRMGDEVLVLSRPPARVVYRWEQTRPPHEREPSELHHAVAELLQQPAVADSFGVAGPRSRSPMTDDVGPAHVDASRTAQKGAHQ